MFPLPLIPTQPRPARDHKRQPSSAANTQEGPRDNDCSITSSPLHSQAKHHDAGLITTAPAASARASRSRGQQAPKASSGALPPATCSQRCRVALQVSCRAAARHTSREGRPNWVLTARCAAAAPLRALHPAPGNTAGRICSSREHDRCVGRLTRAPGSALAAPNHSAAPVSVLLLPTVSSTRRRGPRRAACCCWTPSQRQTTYRWVVMCSSSSSSTQLLRSADEAR